MDRNGKSSRVMVELNLVSALMCLADLAANRLDELLDVSPVDVEVGWVLEEMLQCNLVLVCHELTQRCRRARGVWMSMSIAYTDANRRKYPCFPGSIYIR